VITEDEVMRLLERADPARVDDSAPFVDAAGYLAALRTRSTTVTLIDTEPTPSRPKGHRRWPIIAVAAAAVVAIVVGGLALASRDDDPNEQIPAGTTVAPDPATAAEEVARGFLHAYAANDADLGITFLTESALATNPYWGSPEGVRRDVAWSEAARFKVIVNDCERRADTEAGTVVRCGFDLHALGSDALGIGPFGDNYWDLTVRDRKIVSAPDWVLAAQTNGFYNEVWAPFAGWIRTEHPDDVLVMYTAADQNIGAQTDEAIELWRQRTQEFVQAVLTGPETYAADVTAICATMAARLGELAEPAEGRLDRVAAWNTAAAAIMEQAHGNLVDLVEPPRFDSSPYVSFKGRLISLVRIAEESAQAATAGDSTSLAELDAEYLELRQAMSSGPAGSGLEECRASLPR
jgi:hypothetical protein